MNLSSEIERVKRTIEETQSPYLRRDYQKYLKKLYKQLRSETYGKERTKTKG